MINRPKACRTSPLLNRSIPAPPGTPGDSNAEIAVCSEFGKDLGPATISSLSIRGASG